MPTLSKRNSPGEERQGVMTLHDTVAALGAVIASAVAGALTWSAQAHSLPAAVLAAGTAFGASFWFFRRWIRQDP